jgi:hypothetical protein
MAGNFAISILRLSGVTDAALRHHARNRTDHSIRS